MGMGWRRWEERARGVSGVWGVGGEEGVSRWGMVSARIWREVFREGFERKEGRGR
jgi:hypothetical protein